MNKFRKPAFYTFFISIAFLVSSGYTFRSSEEDRYNKILHTIGYILKSGHYSPQAVNDNFSEKIFNAFIKDLDPEKMIFLEKDIENLKDYFHAIDEEITGLPVEFFYKANDLYKQRLTAVKENHLNILEKPFQYLEKDSIITVYDQRNYANSEKNQMKLWTKKMKYLSLSKFVDLQDQRQKSKTDSTD